MTPPAYEQFFKVATDGHSPFDYQTRLGEDPECKPRLINTPTGCGIALSKNTVDGQAAYFAALEAADHRDFQPLVNISRDHPAHAETPDA